MSHPAPYPPFSLPQRQLRLEFSAEVPSDAAAVGHVVFVGDEPPASVGVNAARATELGFTAQAATPPPLSQEQHLQSYLKYNKHP